MVENGLFFFLNRFIEDVENDGVDLIILDIDIFGGVVDVVFEIVKSLILIFIFIVVFVDKKVLLVGVYIVFNVD